MGYLGRIASRSLGSERSLSPRIPGTFEHSTLALQSHHEVGERLTANPSRFESHSNVSPNTDYGHAANDAREKEGSKFPIPLESLDHESDPVQARLELEGSLGRESYAQGSNVQGLDGRESHGIESNGKASFAEMPFDAWLHSQISTVENPASSGSHGSWDKKRRILSKSPEIAADSEEIVDPPGSSISSSHNANEASFVNYHSLHILKSGAMSRFEEYIQDYLHGDMKSNLNGYMRDASQGDMPDVAKYAMGDAHDDSQAGRRDGDSPFSSRRRAEIGGDIHAPLSEQDRKNGMGDVYVGLSAIKRSSVGSSSIRHSAESDSIKDLPRNHAGDNSHDEKSGMHEGLRQSPASSEDEEGKSGTMNASHQLTRQTNDLMTGLRSAAKSGSTPKRLDAKALDAADKTSTGHSPIIVAQEMVQGRRDPNDWERDGMRVVYPQQTGKMVEKASISQIAAPRSPRFEPNGRIVASGNVVLGRPADLMQSSASSGRAAGKSASVSRPSHQDSGTIVHISIGRVEIRAASPPSTSQRKEGVRRSTSLDEHLRKRSKELKYQKT